MNVIFGSAAYSAFLNNQIVQKRADIRNFSLDGVRAPQRDSVGAALHGEVSAGSYRARLWTYPEFYDNANGQSTPYLDADKAIILPEDPRFKLAFAAVPQLIDEENPVAVKGAYLIGEMRDKYHAVHEYDIKSAGIAVPVAVDQIYTVKVVGDGSGSE